LVDAKRDDLTSVIATLTTTLKASNDAYEADAAEHTSRQTDQRQRNRWKFPRHRLCKHSQNNS